MVVLLWIHSSRQVGYVLEKNLDHLEVYSGVAIKISFLNIVREILVLSTLKASRELKNWYFTMKFLSQHHLYVNNTCTKFQGQMIHQKK